MAKSLKKATKVKAKRTKKSSKIAKNKKKIDGKTVKKVQKLKAEDLTQKQLRELAASCFDSLREKVEGVAPPKKPFKLPSNVSCPLFVTWLIGKSKRLRGCIGSFEPLSLNDNLKEFALVSALEDDRFKPIKKKDI